MNESEKQLSFTRAASSTSGRAKKQRRGKVNYPVKKYYEDILRAAQAVETVTGRNWDLSANLSKSTSNERLRLRLNDVVPSMLLALSPIL
jgi:hypothetical protein